jgi:hypothetical protein
MLMSTHCCCWPSNQQQVCATHVMRTVVHKSMSLSGLLVAQQGQQRSTLRPNDARKLTATDSLYLETNIKTLSSAYQQLSSGSCTLGCL